MKGPDAAPDFDIAIVGAGAGGVLAALHALRLARVPARIALIEPEPRLGQGIAYATVHPEHVLNVPARGMSAFDDAPQDFVDYLAETGAAEEVGDARGDPGVLDAPPAARFIERHRYGSYLCDRLERARAASPARLEVVRDRVVALDRSGERAALRLASGARLHADGVVLAVGNTPKPMPVRGASALPAGTGLDAWDYDAIKRIGADEAVCIVGSGLSMVDVVLSLAAAGHRAPVHVLTRHALLPLPHAAAAPAAFEPAGLLGLDLRGRLRRLRGEVREAQRQGLPWQAVMERLRPHGQALWQSLSVADQRRFLRHVVRLWDVHRHRVAAPVHARLQRLHAEGGLQLHRGRVQGVECEGRRVRVRWRDRAGRPHSLDADRLVNATGLELRARTMRNPLLNDLLDQGIVQPGPHGIGITVARDGSAVDADDRPLPWLQVLGSLRIGCLWESTAVPELRTQAEHAARLLLSRLAE